MIELTPEQEYQRELAWKALNLAEKMIEQKRRAKGQEVLREAQELMFKLPSGFTDQAFDEQYLRAHNQLYRGY